MDAPRLPSASFNCFLHWSHSTRQSFVESALSSPPTFALLHLLTPSSACIYPAGVIESVQDKPTKEKPLGVVLRWSCLINGSRTFTKHSEQPEGVWSKSIYCSDFTPIKQNIPQNKKSGRPREEDKPPKTQPRKHQWNRKIILYKLPAWVAYFLSTSSNVWG